MGHRLMLACLCVIVLSAPTDGVAGGAGAPVVTEAWEGVWEIETTVRDCETQNIISTSSTRDSLCAGDPIPFEGGEADLTCDGTANDTSFELHCSGSNEWFPGCVAHTTLTATGTRDGDSFSATATMETTFEGTGKCEFFPDQCLLIETAGTRVEDGCVTTPVEPLGWGKVKSRFR